MGIMSSRLQNPDYTAKGLPEGVGEVADVLRDLRGSRRGLLQSQLHVLGLTIKEMVDWNCASFYKCESDRKRGVAKSFAPPAACSRDAQVMDWNLCT
jgi:hypothetical protein